MSVTGIAFCVVTPLKVTADPAAKVLDEPVAAVIDAPVAIAKVPDAVNVTAAFKLVPVFICTKFPDTAVMFKSTAFCVVI